MILSSSESPGKCRHWSRHGEKSRLYTTCLGGCHLHACHTCKTMQHACTTTNSTFLRHQFFEWTHFLHVVKQKWLKFDLALIETEFFFFYALNREERRITLKEIARIASQELLQ